MEKLPAVKCRYPDRRKKQSTELNHEDSQKPNSGALTPLRVSDTKELKDYVFCSTDRHRFMGESESDDSDELDLVLNLEMEPDPASYLILNEVMENFTIPFKRPIKLLNDRRKTMVTVNGDMKFQVHVGTSVMKDIDEVSEESPEVLITPGGSPAEHSNRDVKKKLCFAEERLEEVVCDHLEDTCHEEDRTETHRKGDKGLKLVGFQLNTDEVIEEDDKREENVGTKRSEEINQDTDKIDEQGESIIMNVQPLITESSLEKVKELKDDDDITEEEQIENNLSISVIFPFSPEKCIDYSDVGFFADDDESELDSIKRRKKKIRGKSFPTKLHTGEGHERSGIVVQKTSDSKYINSINLRRNIKHIDYDSTLIGSEIFSFFPRDSQDRYETAYSAAKTEFYPDLLCKYSPSEIKTEFLHIPSESIQHIEEELGSSSTESSSSECFGYEFPSQYFDEDSINVMKKYRYQLVSNETSAKGIHYLKSMIDIINLSDDPDQKYSSSHSLDRSLEDTLLSSPQLLLHTAEERGVSCQEDNKCLTKKCDVRDLPHKEDTYHSKDDVVERYKKFLKKQARRTGTHFAPLPPTETDSEGRVIPLHRTVPKILIGKEYDPCSAVIAQPGAHPSFERFLQLGYFGTEFQHKHHILGFQPGYVEAVVKRYEEKTEELRKKKRILKMKSLQAEENEENVVGEPEKEEDDIRAVEIDEELSGEQTNSIKGRLSEEEEEEAKSEEHELRTESIKEICIKAKDKSEKTKSENGNLGGLVIGKWEDDTVKREEESSDKDDDGIKVIYCRPMGENAEFKAHFEWSTESFKTYFDSSSNTSDSDTSSNKSDSSTSSSTSLPQKTICELYSGNISHTSVSYSNLDSNMVSSEPSIPPLPCGSSDEDLVIANDEITRLKKISNLKQLPKAYFCLKESHEICRTYQALSDKLISFIRILDDREDEWWKIPVNDFCCEDMQVTYPKDFLTPCSKKLLFIETPVGRKRLAYFDECLLQKECICKVTYRSLESIKNNPISWDEVSGLFPNKNKEDNFSNLNPSNIDPTAGSLLEIDPEALIAVKEYEIWPLRRDLIYELVQFFFIPITFRPEYYSVNMKTYWSFVGDVKGDAKKNRKKENSLKKALALLGAKLFDPCRPCCKRVNILPKVTALLSHKASEISPIGKVILTNFVCFTRRKVVIKLKNRTPYQLQYMVNGTYFSDPPKEEISTKLNIALAKPTVRQDLSVTIPKQCGIIPPKGIIKVRIYVAASTWGIYEERLVFYLEGMKPCEVSLTVQVEDSPVVFPGILRAVRNIPTTRYLCEELASKHYMALAVKNASNDPVNVEWHCFVIEPNEFEWPQGIRYMLLQLRKLCEEKNQIISGIFRRRIKELVRQLYFNRKADLETLSTNYLGKDQEDTVMDTETEQEIILLMNMCDVILHNEYHVKETLPEEDEKNYYRVLDESSHLIPNELNWLRFCYHALGWDIGTRRDMKIQSVLIGLIKRATDTPIEPEGRCSRGEEFNTQPVLLHLQALVPFPRLIMDGTDEDNLSFKFKAMDILHQVEGSNIVSKKYYLMNDDDILVSVRLHVKKPFYIAGYHLISTESNSSGSLTYSGEKSSSENNVLRIPPRSCAEIEVTCQLTRVHVYKARAVMVEAQQQYLPYYVYPELNQKSIAVDAKLSIIHTPELRQHFPLQLEVVFPTIRVNTYEVNFSNVNIMDHKEMWILLRNYSDQPFEYDIDTTNVTNFVIWNNYTNLEGMGEVSIKICFHPRTLGPHAETFYIYNTFFKDEQQEITVRGYAYLVSPEIDKQNEEIIRQQRERENLKNLRQKAAKKKLTDAEREMLKELELQESMVPKDDVEKTAKVKGKEKRKRQLKRWETEDWLNISIPFWEKNFNSCQDRTGRRSSEPSIPQLFDTEDKADLSKTTVWAPNPFTRGLLSQSQNNNDPDDSTETESNNAGPRPQLGL